MRRGRSFLSPVPWLLSLFLSLFLSPVSCPLSPAFATMRQEVYVTGTVQSFGGYIFTEAVEFNAAEPGQRVVGSIVVDGLYNGEYPWVMRVYTDNLHFAGIAGAVERPIATGLISADGRFAIPLQIQSPAFGPEEWRRIPDLNEPGYQPYQPASTPDEKASTQTAS